MKFRFRLLGITLFPYIIIGAMFMGEHITPAIRYPLWLFSLVTLCYLLATTKENS